MLSLDRSSKDAKIEVGHVLSVESKGKILKVPICLIMNLLFQFILVVSFSLSFLH